MSTDLRIVKLSKVFVSPGERDRRITAVQDVDLEVAQGSLVTLLGPSGCGKTTLLRMIAGFEEPTAGDIYFGDRRVNDAPPNARDAAMVFQSYAIFPHLSVFENVAFGLRIKRRAAREVEERVRNVLDLTGLSGLAGRSPGELSGGQQQRVALARCIVTEPKLLLFDEPLSNLDAKLREQMRIEIRDLQQRLGITSLYVTHDQVEAMSMSDQLVVMNAGTVEQIGPPREVYARPRTRFVADFIGKANFLPGTVTAPDVVETAGVVMRLPPMPQVAVGARVTLVVRPEAVELSADKGDFRGIVRRVTFLGNVAEYAIEVEGSGAWLVDVANPGEVGLRAAGETVYVTPSRASVQVLLDSA